MMEKIDVAEENADKEAIPSSFGDSFKQLLYAQLVSGGEEAILERQQRRKIGLVVAWIAGGVPLVALGTLFYVMVMHSKYFFNMEAFPQAVLISASFLSMVVIYSFLIKGMFPGTQKMTRITHIPLLMRH